MRKYLYICFILILKNGYSQNELKLSSNIKSAIVYEENAVVTRQAIVYLNEGEHKIIFEKISEFAIPNSIQIYSKGNVMLQSIEYEYKEEELNSEIKMIKDSISKLNKKMKFIDVEIQSQKNLKLVLEKNQNAGSKKEFVQPDILEEIYQYQKTKWVEIGNQIVNLNIEKEKLIESIKKLEKQLKKLNLQYTEKTLSFIANVIVNTDSQIEFELKYIVYKAGWNPSYNIRGEDKKIDNLNFELLANVYQATGINWENIKLYFSTGSPNLNINIPEIHPVYLNFKVKPKLYSKQRIEKSYQNYDVESTSALALKQKNKYQKIYEIKNSTTLPSSKNKKIIKIEEQDIPVFYELYSVPKINNNIYIIANITKCFQYQLFNTSYRIFYNDNFIMQSDIKLNAQNDTLKLAMGIDENVEIKRNKLKNYYKTKKIGDKIKAKFGIELIVKNKNSKNIILKIEDQIPVSKRSEINVTLENTKGKPVYNNQSGKLTWKINLKSGEIEKLEFNYSVLYPEKERIKNIEN